MKIREIFKIKEIDDLTKIWGTLIIATILLSFICYPLMPKEPYSKEYDYDGTKYYIYLAYENDDFLLAGVRNCYSIKSKVIDVNYALENGLITEIKNPFKRFTFDAEKIIKFVIN